MTQASPSLTGLLHVAIKSADLTRTGHSYLNILEMEEFARPDFGYPGDWIGVPGVAAIIHVYAGGPALGTEGIAHLETAFDHVSIATTDYHGFVARLVEAGIPHREFVVPGTPLWQLFAYDPSGAQIELTFDSRSELGPPPDMSAGRGYVTGQGFLDPACHGAN